MLSIKRFLFVPVFSFSIISSEAMNDPLKDLEQRWDKIQEEQKLVEQGKNTPLFKEIVNSLDKKIDDFSNLEMSGKISIMFDLYRIVAPQNDKVLEDQALAINILGREKIYNILTYEGLKNSKIKPLRTEKSFLNDLSLVLFWELSRVYKEDEAYVGIYCDNLILSAFQSFKFYGLAGLISITPAVEKIKNIIDHQGLQLDARYHPPLYLVAAYCIGNRDIGLAKKYLDEAEKGEPDIKEAALGLKMLLF